MYNNTYRHLNCTLQLQTAMYVCVYICRYIQAHKTLHVQAFWETIFAKHKQKQTGQIFNTPSLLLFFISLSLCQRLLADQSSLHCMRSFLLCGTHDACVVKVWSASQQSFLLITFEFSNFLFTSDKKMLSVLLYWLVNWFSVDSIVFCIIIHIRLDLSLYSSAKYCA